MATVGLRRRSNRQRSSWLHVVIDELPAEFATPDMLEVDPMTFCVSLNNYLIDRYEDRAPSVREVFEALSIDMAEWFRTRMTR